MNRNTEQTRLTPLVAMHSVFRLVFHVPVQKRNDLSDRPNLGPSSTNSIKKVDDLGVLFDDLEAIFDDLLAISICHPGNRLVINQPQRTTDGKVQQSSHRH